MTKQDNFYCHDFYFISRPRLRMFMFNNSREVCSGLISESKGAPGGNFHSPSERDQVSTPKSLIAAQQEEFWSNSPLKDVWPFRFPRIQTTCKLYKRRIGSNPLFRIVKLQRADLKNVQDMEGQFLKCVHDHLKILTVPCRNERNNESQNVKLL